MILLNPPACRHCGAVRPMAARRLCNPCYYIPAVKNRYGPISKFGRRGLLAPPGPRPLPEPTEATPGTPEKLAVLVQRAERGQQLWHPLDAPIPGPTVPATG